MGIHHDIGTVLVIEDHSTLSGILRAALRKEGYQVTVTTSFPSAIEQLEATPFGVILTDVLCDHPPTDPIAQWARVEQIRVLADPAPVVLFTTADWPGSLASNDVPFDLDGLLATVHELLTS